MPTFVYQGAKKVLIVSPKLENVVVRLVDSPFLCLMADSTVWGEIFGGKWEPGSSENDFQASTS